MRVPSLSPFAAAAVGLALAWTLACSPASRPALAFDDAQFCAAATQFSYAAEGDVGTWVDRYTRNDGIDIGCDLKTVHFKRFYKGPVAGEAWLNEQTDIWQGSHCTRSIWREAVANGWVVSATIQIANGPRIWLGCGSNGEGFYRMLP